MVGQDEVKDLEAASIVNFASSDPAKEISPPARLRLTPLEDLLPRVYASWVITAERLSPEPSSIDVAN